MTRPVPASTWAVVVVLQLVAASAFLPSHASALLAPVLAGSVLVPVGLVLLGRRLRLSAVTVAVATAALGFVAATLVTAAVAAETPAGATGAGPVAGAEWRRTPAGDLVAPLLDAVSRVVTGPRPVPATTDTLVPAALLVLLVSLAVALTTARTGTTTPGLVGAVGTYVAAQLLGVGRADPGGVVAASLVALTCLAWVVRDVVDGIRVERTPDRLGAPARRRTAWPGARAGAAAAGLAVLLVVGVQAVPLGRAFDARDHLPVPVTTVALGHPLTQVPVWHAHGDDELFHVAGALPDRLRLVALARYDGVTWTPGEALRPLGSAGTGAEELPPGAELGRMTADVRLTGLTDAPAGAGDWVPSAGHLRDASGSVLVEPTTGSLLLPRDAAGTRARGTVYRVEADVDVPGPDRLAAAGAPPADVAGPHLAVPGLPDALDAFAHDAVAGATTRWAQVEALADAVAGDRLLVPDAPGGSSYARLEEFLLAPADAGGQTGTEEQVAASFAVLARGVGIPSRVVVGFRLPEPEGDGDVVVVRGRHATVWPEVYLVGAGWVPVDVGTTVAGPAGAAAGDPQELAAPAEEAAPAEAADGDGPADPAGPARDDGVPRPVVAALAVGGGLAAVGLLGVLGLVLARAVRRARLRRWGAVGAWAHVEDALRLAGELPGPGEPASVVAARVAPPGGDVRRLALAAEREAFGPGSARPGADRAAWRTAVRTGRRLRRSAPLRRRLVWSVHPGPVRARPSTRPGGRAG